MNDVLREALTRCETDIDGVMARFYGNEDLYMSLLTAFKDEPTMGELNSAVESSEWDKAFIAAHALKGLAGNMGFIPLFHTVGEMVLILRDGRFNELCAKHEEIKKCYNDLISIIYRYVI